MNIFIILNDINQINILFFLVLKPLVNNEIKVCLLKL